MRMLGWELGTALDVLLLEIRTHQAGKVPLTEYPCQWTWSFGYLLHVMILNFWCGRLMFSSLAWCDLLFLFFYWNDKIETTICLACRLWSDWRTRVNISISNGSVDGFFIVYCQNYKMLQVLSAPPMVPSWLSTVTCVKGKGYLFFHCSKSGQHCLYIPNSAPFHEFYRKGMLYISSFPTI